MIRPSRFPSAKTFCSRGSAGAATTKLRRLCGWQESIYRSRNREIPPPPPATCTAPTARSGCPRKRAAGTHTRSWRVWPKRAHVLCRCDHPQPHEFHLQRRSGPDDPRRRHNRMCLLSPASRWRSCRSPTRKPPPPRAPSSQLTPSSPVATDHPHLSCRVFSDPWRPCFHTGASTHVNAPVFPEARHAAAGLTRHGRQGG